jgi:hypothetical protein
VAPTLRSARCCGWSAGVRRRRAEFHFLANTIRRIPNKPFNRIARLDVHLEKTGFVRSSFDDALPELKKQARQAGADAVIEIQEIRSQILETMVYHVTATGVRYVPAP